MYDRPSSDFYIPLNLPDISHEVEPEAIEKVLALPGNHPFFNAFNFKIPQSAIELSNKIGLTIAPTKTFLFHLKPKSWGPIHKDGNPSGTGQRMFGINWAWDTDDTAMLWFEETKPPEIFRYAGIDLPHYTTDNTRNIFAARLRGANLVNVEYPHNVYNKNDRTRLAISIGFKEELPWTEVVALMYQHNLVRESNTSS